METDMVHLHAPCGAKRESSLAFGLVRINGTLCVPAFPGEIRSQCLRERSAFSFEELDDPLVCGGEGVAGQLIRTDPFEGGAGQGAGLALDVFALEGVDLDAEVGVGVLHCRGMARCQVSFPEGEAMAVRRDSGGQPAGGRSAEPIGWSQDGLTRGHAE